MKHVYCPNCEYERVPVGSPKCPSCGNVMSHICGAPVVPYGSPECPGCGYRFYWPKSKRDAVSYGIRRVLFG